MLLLDTHALLWALSAVARLPTHVRTVLEHEDTRVFVSAASVWEMRIKSAQGKLTMPENLTQQLDVARFEPLNITIAHALVAGGLPPYHRDPFDRMLIAQAQLENLTIVTHDGLFRHYGIPIMWI